MEVSSEISQKIRSAIKAKLQELGAYVDDELPDYIMVMVANKRSRSQMKNDLGLFLADNTDAFTEWLHCLLVKLQTIRSDSDKSTDKLNALREKKKDGKLHKVVQAGKKGGKLVNKKKIDKRSSDLMTSDHSDGIIAKRKVTSIDRQLDTEETQLQGGYNGGECMEHDIKDSFDGNSFMHNKQIDAKNVQDSIDLRQFSVTEASGDTLTDDQETEVVDSRAVGVLKIVDISDGTINQSTSVKGLISEQHVQSSAVRKRRASTSALDHVSKVGSYDPFNPAVRTMASFVSETALKSTSLQTNRALLLKAMEEAEQTIAIMRKLTGTKTIGQDSSPVKVYSPEQSDHSHYDHSPPRYIPSRRDSISPSSRSVSQFSQTQALVHAAHSVRLASQEIPELISKYPEKYVQASGSHTSSHHSKSLRCHQRGRKWPDRYKSFTCQRVVKGDELANIKNFQITTDVRSSKLQSSFDKCHSKTHWQGLSPRSMQSLQVVGNPDAIKMSQISVTRRLGKAMVDRKDRKPTAGINLNVGSYQLHTRDWDDDQGAILKGGKSELNESHFRKFVASRVVSRLGSDAAALISSGTEHRQGRSHSPDDREGHIADHSQVCWQKYLVDNITDSKGDNAPFAASSGCTKEMSIMKIENSNNKADDLAAIIDNEANNDKLLIGLDDADIGIVTGDNGSKLMGTGVKRNENRTDTKFIVTLDGVDERQFNFEDNKSVFEKSKSPFLSVPAPTEVTAAYNLEEQHLKQMLLLDLLAVQKRTEPRALLQEEQALIYLKHSKKTYGTNKGRVSATRFGSYHPTKEVLEDDNVSAIKRAKMTQRCTFWPACAAGSSCEFHHPTTQCKLFPNCMFGRNCLFIHPNCRFDSKCSRRDCPYTHMSRRSALANTSNVIALPQSQFIFSSSASLKPHILRSSSQTTCRYFPHCQNVNCPFLHPKPCRFGSTCKSPTCPFFHKKAPHHKKLKWQAHWDKPKSRMATLLTSAKMEHVFLRTPSSTKTAVFSRSQ